MRWWGGEGWVNIVSGGKRQQKGCNAKRNNAKNAVKMVEPGGRSSKVGNAHQKSRKHALGYNAKTITQTTTQSKCARQQRGRCEIVTAVRSTRATFHVCASRTQKQNVHACIQPQRKVAVAGKKKVKVPERVCSMCRYKGWGRNVRRNRRVPFSVPEKRRWQKVLLQASCHARHTEGGTHAEWV